MNQPLALETASVSIGAPFEGARRGVLLYRGLGEKGEILFFSGDV